LKSIWEKSNSFYEIDKLGVRSWPSLPTGITVHYTADGDLDRVKREMDKTKIGYHFIIDREGKIHQTANLAKAVNHAGKAMWNGQSPNRTHLAISVLSWGLVNRDGLSWNGTRVLNVEKRMGELWDIATQKQESVLKKLIQDLMTDFQISAANICGHEECAIPRGRKIDPGGVLSFTMAQLRKELST
jgi:N-acetyl-anhydromuramyl-L-alanine amidase AmpD